jgi:chaperonin GroES
MEFDPYPGKIIAQNEDIATTTKSGLLIPETAQERPLIAVVLAVGQDTVKAKVGDRIIYKPYATTPIKEGGKEYLIIQEEDILTGIKLKETK